MFGFKFKFGYAASSYNPLINYDWSTTTTSGLRYLKDVGSTPTYNASMYFGRGVYFNGVDQGIYAGTANLTTDSYSIVITTVNRYSSWYSTAMQADNGASVLGFTNTQQARFRVLITEIISSSSIPINTPTTLIGVVTNNIGKLYVNGILDSSAVAVSSASWNNLYIGQRSGNSDYYKGTCKDMFIFSRALTQAEITQAYKQPEAFYTMAQADSTCVLNMPMCETSSTVINYKDGTDHPIINYTSSVRDNAKNLQYGLQTCKFVRDSLGVIQGASDYLACDGVGYANTGWIPSSSEDWTIECGFIAKMDSVIKRIGCGGTNSTQVVIEETTSNRIQAYVGNKQAITTITNPNVEIILVKSNGYALIYINKVQIINELIGLPFSPDEEFRLSGHRLWSTYPWNNTITKFKVHNKALTNEEIQAL